MSTPPAPNALASLYYKALVRTCGKSLNGGTFARWWWKAWTASCSRYSCPVRATIHGRKVVLNFGNTYPINSRLFPAYNAPLVELIYQAYKAKGAKITYADVGAATGDSVLLVHANCGDMVAQTYCVDGDAEFSRYLRVNIAGIPGCKTRYTLLSASGGEVGELVRTHGGTASAGDDHRTIHHTGSRDPGGWRGRR